MSEDLVEGLVNRLEDWRNVHPKDMDKPEGHLYEEAAARIEELEERLKAATDDAKEAEAYAEKLEANLAEQIEWVKSLADDLIAAEGREARLKEKLAKAVEALHQIAGRKDYADDPWSIARSTLAELGEGEG